MHRTRTNPRAHDQHNQHGDHMHDHPHGHRARFSPHGRGGRHRARRGAIVDAVLLLLDERPMHGYELITELEARSEGRWSRAMDLELRAADDPPTFQRAWALYQAAPPEFAPDLLDEIKDARADLSEDEGD